MDPISIASTIVGVLIAVKDARKLMQNNHGDVARLADRLEIFVDPMKLIKQRASKAFTVTALETLKAVIVESKEYIDEFLERTMWRKGMRILRRTDYAQDLAGLFRRIDQCLLDLQLCTGADLQAQQATRREEEIETNRRFIEGMTDTVLNEIQASGVENHAAMDELKDCILRSNEQLARILEIHGHSQLSEAERRVHEEASARLLHSTEARMSEILRVTVDTNRTVHDLENLMKEHMHRDKRSDYIRTNNLLHSASDVVLGVLIGEGGFGRIFQGQFRGEPKPVAVKVVSDPHGVALPDDVKKDAENEVIMLRHVHSANVIAAKGFIHKPYETLLVLEMAEFGSLSGMLGNTAAFPAAERLPVSLLLGWLQDIASGLAYIHSRGVVHKDIKCDNAVLCIDLTVKLCDFGLSKSESTSMLLNATRSSLGIQAGTLAFMAPEITERGADSSKATDMYSMGMTAVQLISRKTPNKIDLARKVRDCVAFATAAPGSPSQENITDSYRQQIVEVLERLLFSSPEERPTARQLVLLFKRLVVSIARDDPRFYETSVDFEAVEELLGRFKKAERERRKALAARPPLPPIIPSRSAEDIAAITELEQWLRSAAHIQKNAHLYAEQLYDHDGDSAEMIAQKVSNQADWLTTVAKVNEDVAALVLRALQSAGLTQPPPPPNKAEEEQSEKEKKRQQQLQREREHAQEKRRREAEAAAKAEAERQAQAKAQQEQKERRRREVEAAAKAKAEAEKQAQAQAQLNERRRREAEAERIDAELRINPLSLVKYRRGYTEAQIAANRTKVAPKGTGEAMYAAAEDGESAELLKLVEPWFAHPVLNDYIGGGGIWTPLMSASYKGHIECVRVLVAQPGIELNKGHRGNQSTALLHASYHGHVDIVELLCSLPGIDCNKADTGGYTPHSRACRLYSGPDKEERTRKIRAILEAKGARSVSAPAPVRATATAAAAAAAAVEPLANYRRSYTEAQIAANRAKKFKLTKTWGILASSVDERKEVGGAMYQAADKGKAAELLKLVEPWFAHPVLNDYSGYGGNGADTPLIAASDKGHIECVQVLVAQPGIELNKGHRDNQSTALLWASSKGHVDIVELLCSLPGIDCNKSDSRGDTPLSSPCNAYTGSDKAVRRRKIRAILEARGAR